jgi:hypothetical protein
MSKTYKKAGALAPGRQILGEGVLSGRRNEKIQHFKFLLIGRGVTARTISFRKCPSAMEGEKL